jgi:hypothetical protein
VQRRIIIEFFGAPLGSRSKLTVNFSFPLFYDHNSQDTPIVNILLMASTVTPESMVPRLIEKAFVLNFHGEEIRIQQVDPEGVTVPQNHVGEDKLANFCFPESVEEIRRTLDSHQ